MNGASNQNKIGHLELISAMFLSGTIGMFVEFSQQPVINIVFYRCTIGAICLLAYCYIKGMLKKQSIASKKELFLVLIVGLSVVLNWLALFSAYSYTSIGIATTIYHMQPIIVFFIGAFLFKEQISGARILWLATSFLGVLLIVNPLDNLNVGTGYVKGCMLALFAACLYAIATLATKSIKTTSSYIITLTQLLLGTLILWPFVQFTVMPQTTLEYSSIIILGIVHSAFMYILLYSSYQKLSTSSIAILSYIYPLVAVAIDFLVFHRTLSTWQIIGGTMVLAAGLCNKLGINPFYRVKLPKIG